MPLTSDHAQLHEWVEDMQMVLWHDLGEDLRNAVNGSWSISAADTSLAIVTAARLVGPTSPDNIPWPLVAGGVYEAVLTAGQIEHEPVEDVWLEVTEPLMGTVGLAGVEAQRLRFAATVEAIQQPAETAYLREGE
jgi:hypothetical protein